jgi:hypothetical protein
MKKRGEPIWAWILRSEDRRPYHVDMLPGQKIFLTTFLASSKFTPT